MTTLDVTEVGVEMEIHIPSLAIRFFSKRKNLYPFFSTLEKNESQGIPAGTCDR